MGIVVREVESRESHSDHFIQTYSFLDELFDKLSATLKLFISSDVH